VKCGQSADRRFFAEKPHRGGRFARIGEQKFHNIRCRDSEPPKMRWVILALCAVAVFGFFQPAVNVHLSFFGITRTFDFSLATIFEDSPADTLNLNDSDLSDLLDETDILADIVRRVALSVISYVLAFVLLVIMTVFAVLNKFAFAKTVINAVALILLIVAGRAMLTVPGMVADALSDFLGFFARLINVYEILSMTLGWGYWVSLCACIAVILLGCKKTTPFFGGNCQKKVLI